MKANEAMKVETFSVLRAKVIMSMLANALAPGSGEWPARASPESNYTPRRQRAIDKRLVAPRRDASVWPPHTLQSAVCLQLKVLGLIRPLIAFKRLFNRYMISA